MTKRTEPAGVFGPLHGSKLLCDHLLQVLFIPSFVVLGLIINIDVLRPEFLRDLMWTALHLNDSSCFHREHESEDLPTQTQRRFRLLFAFLSPSRM